MVDEERETLLKAAFPLAVHAERSTAETQFGHVHRATHTNTSWDAARFEICAHRWLHVGEPGYGVAVVNDSTYGHDVSRPGPGDARGAGEPAVVVVAEGSARGPVHEACHWSSSSKRQVVLVTGRRRWQYLLIRPGPRIPG